MKSIFLSGVVFLLCFVQLLAQDNKASMMMGRTSIFMTEGYLNNLEVDANGVVSKGYKEFGRSDRVDLPAQFCVIEVGDGKVAFRATNGKYLSVANGGGSTCAFTATKIEDNEKFAIRYMGNSAFSIRAAKGQYLNYAANVFGATAADEATAQKFYFATFALMQAHNGRYVAAESKWSSSWSGSCGSGAGQSYEGSEYSASSNDNNSSTVWRLEDVGHGKVMASINGIHFKVEGDKCTGSQDMYERSPMTLHYRSGGQFALQTPSGKYFCADDNFKTESGHTTKLVADRANVSTWESFQLLNPDQNMGEGCANDAFLAKAVASNNVGDVKNLLARGAKPSTEQLNMAMDKNPAIGQQLLKSGATPDATTMDMAIKKKDKASLALIIAKGVKPTTAQLGEMLKAKEYEMARLMTNQGGVMPVESMLKDAVQADDLTAAQIITEKGVKGNIHILNESVSLKRSKALYDHLSLGVAPDASTLKAAQLAENMEIFKSIIARGVRCSDENLKTAIYQNRTEYTKVCLENGGEASSGLKHAISYKNKEQMTVCLDYGADANLALRHVVFHKDTEFAKVLVTKYNASGDRLMDEALVEKNIDFARIALVEGKANPSRKLASVADANQIRFTNLMLDHGGDPNLAMHGAIEHKQTTLLARLIQMGANANKPEHITLAVEKASLPMTTMLVDAGASPGPGMKPAIEKDNYDIISYLLSKGASPKGHLSTPACNGKTRTVKLLLDHKGDPNEGMKCATEKNFIEMTQMLLTAGATAAGYMAVPAKKGYEQVVRYLVQFGAPAQEGIAASVEGNHLAIANFLLNSGAKPNDLVKVAANHGNAQMVTALCKFGDAPKPGMMPAVVKGFVEVAQVLVGLGVDPKPYEYLRAAVDNNKAPMVEYLLNQGADVNHKVENDMTLLHIAANNKAAGMVVKVLVEKGADVNAVETTKGNTPLHVAVRHKGEKDDNNMVAIEALVKGGAGVNNINWVGKTGKTVRQYARGGEVKKYLAANGAILNVNKALAAGGVGGPDAAHAAVDDEADDDDDGE